MVNLKKECGCVYEVMIDECYREERPELRGTIEDYYTIPARYGHFYPYSQNHVGYFCTSRHVKKRILDRFGEQITLCQDADDESALVFDKALLSEIALFARAKKRRGRKKLCNEERMAFVTAGIPHRFTGKLSNN